MEIFELLELVSVVQIKLSIFGIEELDMILLIKYLQQLALDRKRKYSILKSMLKLIKET